MRDVLVASPLTTRGRPRLSGCAPRRAARPLLVDVYGVGWPNLALELDRDCEVIARQLLSLHRRDADDPCEDLGDEQPLPPLTDSSQPWQG